MNATVLPSIIVKQLKSSDSAQIIEGIHNARELVGLWNTEESRQQIKLLAREERLFAARLPRDLFRLITSGSEEIAREAAFALVSASKSYQQYYLHCKKFSDLAEPEYDAFVERLEKFLSSDKVHVLTNSKLVYTGESEVHYFAKAIFTLLYRMPFTVGNKPVRLQGLPKWERDCFFLIGNYKCVEMVDHVVVEPSSEEKENGVELKGVANILILKGPYNFTDEGITVAALFNGVTIRMTTKIEGMP